MGAALLDHVERGSHDGALVLDGATSSFLGDFLYLDKRVHVSLLFAEKDIESGGWVRKFGNCGIVRVGSSSSSFHLIRLNRPSMSAHHMQGEGSTVTEQFGYTTDL